MNQLNPKARFLKSGGCALLTDLATNDLFHDALTFALANFTVSLKGDQLSAVKLQGAQEFIQTLLTLPDPETPLKSQPPLRANLLPDNANKSKSKPGLDSEQPKKPAR